MRRRVYRRRPIVRKAAPRVLHGVGAYKSYRRSYSRKLVPKRASYFRSSKLSAPLSALGGIAGTAVGGPAGGALGTVAGNVLAQGIKALTGLGDYTVKQNVFSPGSPPSIVNRSSLPSGAIVVRHKEYLGDVLSAGSSNTFNLVSFDINPGLPQSFPWLSQLAANFQEYEFEGLLFEYRTMSADALSSTNTSLGQVIMATNYNASESNFATKAEMENSEYSQSVKPSECCVHLIECSRRANVLTDLYVRSGAVPSGEDQRFFDLGNFQIATNGLQGSNVNCGELWVSYQCVLKKSLLTSAIGNTIPFCHMNTLTGVANSAPLGTAQVATSNSTLVCTVNSTGTVLTFPSFPFKVQYMMTVKWAGTAAALAYPTLTASTNVHFSSSNLILGDTVNQYVSPPAGVSSGIAHLTQFFNITSGAIPTGSPDTITFSAGGTLPSSPTSFDLFITQIPNMAN